MKIVPYVELQGRTLLKRAYPRGKMSAFVSALSDEYEKLYLADLDGIHRNRPQLDIAREVCEEIPTYYEGGVRFANNVIDMLITGADKAVVGTSTLASLDELRGAFKLSEDITFKVDFRDGIVSFDQHITGRAFLDLARDVREMGVSEMFVPLSLAEEAARAKEAHGLSIGVFAPVSERPHLESLGLDYVVSEDYAD
jgi:phosphoribosylformimino-5-aminoimidazole carboxamide ribonucleotide (ProFAR) isomerase